VLHCTRAVVLCNDKTIGDCKAKTKRRSRKASGSASHSARIARSEIACAYSLCKSQVRSTFEKRGTRQSQRPLVKDAELPLLVTMPCAPSKCGAVHAVQMREQTCERDSDLSHAHFERKLGVNASNRLYPRPISRAA
jgi:hypothetical protein